MSEYSESVTVASNYIQTVFGQFDANIKKIEKEYSVSMILRDDKLKVSGSEEGVKKSIQVIEQLFQMADRGSSIDEQKVDYTISIVNEHPQEAKESLDALYEIMGADAFMKNMEKGLIEVAPLAYMRGRTLDNAYIVLDEAQNTTPAQMKMFLTRIGFGSKAIITGDLSQKDLPHDAQSGLDVALKVLKDIDDISICHLTSLDVVRHPLVQKIVNAYEKYEDKRSRQAKPRKTTTAQKNRGK